MYVNYKWYIYFYVYLCIINKNRVKIIKLCSDRHEHGKLKNKYRLKHAVPELGAGAGSAVFKIAPLSLSELCM